MPGAKTDKSKKKDQDKAFQKAKEKSAAKIVEDKTFGLKNKNKSKKVQQYVNQVQKRYVGKDEQMDELKRKERKQEQEALAKQKKELEDLYAVAVSQPKLQNGEDPKSILCAFFKVGKCKKGDKCKFSHDLSIANKSSKKSLYTDVRDVEEETMADWDQTTLEKAIEENNKRSNKNVSRSKTICKYFLDALENETFGWFWKCPGGVEHALPEGFVFKTKKEREMERMLKQGSEIDKELLQLEKLEELRALLPSSGLTPVNQESFKKWKEERIKKKNAEQQLLDQQEQSKKNTKSVKDQYGMSGRDLFSFNPSLFVDDDEADNEHYDVEESDYNIPENNEINEELFGDDELPSEDEEPDDNSEEGQE